MKKTVLFLAAALAALLLTACSQTNAPAKPATPAEKTATEIPGSETLKVSGTASIKKTTVKVDLKPTRDPAPGCEWVESTAGDELAIKMLMEKCPETPIDEEKMVISYSPVMRNFPDPLPWMIVFRKSATLSPEMAIQEQIINNLPIEQRQNCIVKKDETITRKDIEIYTIQPTPEYRTEQQAEGNYFDLCGIYGETNGIQYFEFQKQNPVKFLFLLIGQDYPQFDAVYVMPEEET